MCVCVIQCSVTCGEGVSWRDVYCYDGGLLISPTECDQLVAPPSSQACNLQPCQQQHSMSLSTNNTLARVVDFVTLQLSLVSMLLMTRLLWERMVTASEICTALKPWWVCRVFRVNRPSTPWINRIPWMLILKKYCFELLTDETNNRISR